MILITVAKIDGIFMMELLRLQQLTGSASSLSVQHVHLALKNKKQTKKLDRLYIEVDLLCIYMSDGKNKTSSSERIEGLGVFSFIFVILII